MLTARPVMSSSVNVNWFPPSAVSEMRQGKLPTGILPVWSAPPTVRMNGLAVADAGVVSSAVADTG